MRALILTICLLAQTAGAQVLNGQGAAAQLFKGSGHGLLVSGALSPSDRATIQALLPIMEKRLSQPIRYYGAIAFSPADGVVSESLQAAINHHSTEAASRAALSACEAAKTRGFCAVAAQIVPQAYAQRAFTLSETATIGFFERYLRAGGPKAFATSARTGAWGMGPVDAAALADCAKAGAPDCRVTIRN